MRNFKQAVAGAALAGALAAGGPTLAQTPAAPAPPKLVVAVVVDQLGADLFNQYRGRFTGGLKTLADAGLVYPNGFQTHGMTETCPGHSTVLTGVHPNRTGIAANNWLDRGTGERTYCLSAPRNTLADGGKGENGPVGPDNLRASSFGEWLKAATPASRVYAVSGKDRGAITLAGAGGDGAFWYQEGFGFTTYLRPGETAGPKLAPMARLNARVNARFKARPPGWTYQRPECRALAGEWRIGGEVLRSTLPLQPPAKFAIDSSPVLDELTLEAAETLLREQRLGRGAATDVLGVSLSATDRVGHRYGTQGPEMCEQLHRLDAALGRFLKQLEGLPGGAVVVLTADHGGADFVERAAAQGYPEARRPDPTLLPRLNAAVRTRFGLGHDPLKADGTGLWAVGPKGEALPEAQRMEIAGAAAALLGAEPGVVGAYTSEALSAAPSAARSIHPDILSLPERLALSNVLGRSPDVTWAWAPGMTPYGGRAGGYIAGHGTPWDHDRRVPIIFWRPGERTGQERVLPVRTVDIAPTLAAVTGAQAPVGLDGRCLDLGDLGLASCPRPAPAP